jgi:PAS domain S-box-containing protein
MPERINMLKTILDEMESGFVILKMIFGDELLPDDFSIVEVNTPFEEITGISLKEFVGINYSANEKDLNFMGYDWPEEYRSLAVEHKFRNREKYFEGSQTYLRIRTFIPQRGYLVIIVTDITPLRKVEKETGMEEYRLRSLVENCRDGFLFFTPDEKITSASTNIREIIGYSEEELKIIPDLGFLKVEDRLTLTQTLHQVLVHPRIASEIEFQVIQKDGSRPWFEGTFHNLLQAKGVNSIVLKLKEITKRKNEEIEFYHIATRLLRNYPI